MKHLRYAAFLICLAFWGWFGWHYVSPVSGLYFDILVSRQGLYIACLSWFLSLMLGLWVLYGHVMNLQRVIKNDTAPKAMKALGYFILPPALFMDWLANIILSFFMLDPPEHPMELVTGRLERYENDPSSHWYHKGFASGIGHILHALDWRGRHY